MIEQYGSLLLKWLTYYFFFLIVAAVVVSNIAFIPVFLALDWGNIQTFVEVLRVILFWVIGVEFARLLIEYKSEIVIELLIFVIARKLLLLDDDIVSVSLAAFTIVVLLLSLAYIKYVQKYGVGKINSLIQNKMKDSETGVTMRD